MTEKAMPKIGEAIPINKVFISKMNVRFGETFGKSDKDFTLAENVKQQGVVSPMIARPEGNGYGVVQGSRRYHSLKKAGNKKLIVGKDIVVRPMTDKQAFDESLRENLDIFRRELNPIERAKAIQKRLEIDKMSLRELARTWKVPLSNMSVWLTVLELSPKMQEQVAKGTMYFTDALNIAHMKLSVEVQNKLAETLEKRGYDAFKTELSHLKSEKERRGLPAGEYWILRLSLKKDRQDYREAYEMLERLAKVMKKPIDDVAIEMMLKGLATSSSKKS